MCGVIGVAGRKPVLSELLTGLSNLEYRGYDSAGVALCDHNGHIQRQRVCGKVANLNAALEGGNYLSHTGIGHTRWATHGAPTVHNAHPHMWGDSLAIVHNGIIENYDILGEHSGCQAFSSQTDTERLLAYLGHLTKKFEGDMPRVFDDLIENIQGQYAFLIVSKKHPGEIFACCNNSSLVIGSGEAGHYVCSDVYAISQWIDNFLVVPSSCWVKMTNVGHQIYNQKGKILGLKPQKVQRSGLDHHLGDYAHYMEKEITQQPSVLSALAKTVLQNNTLNSNFLPECILNQAKKLQYVQIIACGSSYHAGLFSAWYFQKLLGIPVSVYFASQFMDAAFNPLPHGLCIFISQSGETADTLACLRRMKSLAHAPLTLGVTNVPQSALARLVDAVVLMQAGQEISVAATKTFTAQAFLLLSAAFVLAKVRGMHGEQRWPSYVSFLSGFELELQKAHALRPVLKKWAKQLVGSTYILLIARANLYPIALEAALKIKEISYVHAEAQSAGELKHGSLALIEEGVPVLCLIDKAFAAKMVSNISEVKSRGGRIYALRGEGVLPNDDLYDHQLLLEGESPYFTPFGMTIALQWLAYEFSVLMGTDLDQPRNLAKSVTVE